MTGEPQSLALATSPLRYSGEPHEPTLPTLSIDAAAEKDGWGKWRRVGRRERCCTPPAPPIASTIPPPLSLKPGQKEDDAECGTTNTFHKPTAWPWQQEEGFSPHLTIIYFHQLVPYTTDAFSSQCSQKGQLSLNPDNGSSTTSCFSDITRANRSHGFQWVLPSHAHFLRAHILSLLPINNSLKPPGTFLAVKSKPAHMRAGLPSATSPFALADLHVLEPLPHCPGDTTRSLRLRQAAAAGLLTEIGTALLLSPQTPTDVFFCVSEIRSRSCSLVSFRRDKKENG